MGTGGKSIGAVPALTLLLSFMACAQAPSQVPGRTITMAGNPYYNESDSTPLDLPDSVWRKVLDPEVYHIAREKGTERAFTGALWDHEGIGRYHCAACGNMLFLADSKFASGCGWPSFYRTEREGSVRYAEDRSHGMVRTEVLCGRCGGHLGHVFDDGPPPTGKRYCMNSAVLRFRPQATAPEPPR
ncbi:MAG: Peptide methionine sulfoxide reductase MsrB [Flavobacteriales bacterium]|nr:Peptide methionine sulfoxide reductase MsrB [Flavobacteriales bacterium]